MLRATWPFTGRGRRLAGDMSVEVLLPEGGRSLQATRSITGEPNQGVTTRALALGGAGIGAVVADQQVHRLLGDAVD